MGDLETIKRRQQQAWASGDFARIAVAQTLVGELLCEAVDLHPLQTVLDVATGSGNTALAAARRYADVTGVDFVPSLLERGRARADAEGLRVRFCEGDAESLPFPDVSFDVVLSTFGAMFAPNQEKTVGELLRVCRPGGKIGMANWVPDGLFAQVSQLVARYVSPPAALNPPTRWGTEDGLRELFGPRAAIKSRRRSTIVRSPSPEHWLQTRRRYFGPTVKAFQALDAAGQDALAREMLDLVGRFNQSGDGTVMARGDYLEVVATRT
jgi:SAM-dependent methyltransferase